MTLSWYSLPYMEGKRTFILNINGNCNVTINVTAQQESLYNHKITIYGLYTRTEYKFKVLASNDEGEGDFSHFLPYTTLQGEHIRLEDLPKITKIEFTENRTGIKIDFGDQNFLTRYFFNYDKIEFENFLFQIEIKSIENAKESYLLKPESSDFEKCTRTVNCLILKYKNLIESKPYEQHLTDGVDSFDMRKFIYKRGNIDQNDMRRFESDKIVLFYICFRDSGINCGDAVVVRTERTMLELVLSGFKLFTYRKLALLVLILISILGVLVYRRRRSIRRHLFVFSTIEPMDLVEALLQFIRARFFFSYTS